MPFSQRKNFRLQAHASPSLQRKTPRARQSPPRKNRPASPSPERLEFFDQAMERLFLLSGTRNIGELCDSLGVTQASDNSFESAVNFFVRVIVRLHTSPQYVLYGIGPQRYPDDMHLDEVQARKILSDIFSVNVVLQ